MNQPRAARRRDRGRARPPALHRQQPHLGIELVQRAQQRRPAHLDQRVDPLVHARALELVALPAVEVDAGDALLGRGELEQPRAVRHAHAAHGDHQVGGLEQRYHVLGVIGQHQELAAQFGAQCAAQRRLCFGRERPQLGTRGGAVLARELEQTRAARRGPSSYARLWLAARAEALAAAVVIDKVWDRLADHAHRVVDEMEADRIAHFAGHLFEVLLVAARQQDLADPGAVCGQHLLLDAAHREHVTAQRDLARHRQVAAHRDTDEQARQRHAAAVTPAEGPSFFMPPDGKWM